ncbi:MAG: SMP-30/gluconolactonase/LRE family protein [Deltaproteobacteria bacterium]|nr:SMP-30/gluconolactonase/LRE family protein [Deltaproteobacteria bacterium]
MLRPRFLLLLRALIVFGAALVATWLALPSPIGSLAFIPSPPPALDGPYAYNALLATATTSWGGQVRGAEDIVFDAQGRAHAGLADGRIVRFEGDRVVDVARAPGRPLGLAFAPDGALFSCVPGRGLVRIDPATGSAAVVVDVVEGDPLRHANAVTVASDGSVYFTDSSAVWGPGQFLEDILDQRPSGRVLRYDPRTGAVLVLARDLSFANGLVLSPDESSLLVAETGRYRLWRLGLSGDRKNLKEVVVENLPGFPDNLSRSPRGTYWLGLSSTRKRLIDLTHPYPLWKDAIASLPSWLRPAPVRWGFVLELDDNGRPLRSLQDPDGAVVASVTTVRERDATLWLGNHDGDGVLRLSIP